MTRLYDEFGSPVPCGCCHALHSRWEPQYGVTITADVMTTGVLERLTCPCGAVAPAALVLFTDRVRRGLLVPLTDSTEWPPPEAA